jgi:hypothetical protein
MAIFNRIEGVEDARQHAEGPVARAIEQQTAKLPSDLFLWAALGAMGLSCGLQMMGRKHEALFIGQWPAPLLLMGLYNKLVKVAGSDRMCGGQSWQNERESWQNQPGS